MIMIVMIMILMMTMLIGVSPDLKKTIPLNTFLSRRCHAPPLPRHAAAGHRAEYLVFQLQGRRPHRRPRHGGRPREPDGDDRPDRDAVDVRLTPPAGHPHPGGGGEGQEPLARPPDLGGRERLVRPRLTPGASSLAPGVSAKHTLWWRNSIEF